jgi:hypothetical protein
MFHVELDIRPGESPEVPYSIRELTDQVRVFPEPARCTLELSLTESVFLPDMPATRASDARVPWRHRRRCAIGLRHGRHPQILDTQPRGFG